MNNNFMEDWYIVEIMKMFDIKENVFYVVEIVFYDMIVEKDYNLLVSVYVVFKDICDVVDIVKLNVDLEIIVVKIDQLCVDIDIIVVEIEV